MSTRLEYIDQSEAYKNFINSIDSDATKKNYHYFFPYFMRFCKIDNYDNMLKIELSRLESLIRDYIIYLKIDKKLAPGSISAYLSPISHFYEMNDIDLRWKKLKKFKARLRSVVEDKPYTREQIKILIGSAYLRDKCIILLMASAGLRRGALPYLRIQDLQKIQKYDLYKISVYKKEQEQYITFCTPECTKYIDQYLDWRRRLGEKLLPNSSLFRVVFDTITQVNKPNRSQLM
jgi:integrase